MGNICYYVHLYEDHGMFGGVCYEESSEVRTAGGEDQFVGLEGDAVRAQGDVSEALLSPELLEDVEQLVVVIAPLQHVLGGLTVQKLFG